MSQKSNNTNRKLASRNDENQNAGNIDIPTRKRKAEVLQPTTNEEKDEVPAKVSRQSNDENQNSQENRPSRKRKSQMLDCTVVLEDISNKRDDNQHVPLKIRKMTTEAAGKSGVNNNNSKTIVQPVIVEPKNLNDLADHLLLDIMDYLPVKSRLALAETGHRFNNILKDNPNRLPLKLIAKFNSTDLPEIKRCYRSISIQQLTTPTSDNRQDEVMNFLNQLDNEVINVDMVHVDMTATFFNQVLGKMPRIASLNIGVTSVIDKEQLNETFEQLPLLNLKRVTVNDRNVESIAMILQNVATLEEFVFRSDSEGFNASALTDGTGTDEDDDNLTDDDDDDTDNEEEFHINFDLQADFDGNLLFEAIFGGIAIDTVQMEPQHYALMRQVLKRQSNLKTLEINNGNFFEVLFDECSFQLHHLVLFIPWATNDQLKNIRDFVITQNGLESIVVNILCAQNTQNIRIMNEIVDYVTKLRTMKTLKIVFYEDLSMLEHFRDSLIVNSNIKELYLGLCPSNSHRRDIEAVSRNFPQLEKLELCLDTQWYREAEDQAFEPLNSLRNLTVLKMENIKTEFLTSLRIPTLTTVVNKAVHSVEHEHMQQFYRNNQNIVRLDFQFAHGIIDVVGLVQDIAGNLNRIKRLHVCNCGTELTEDEKERITEIFYTSQSMKNIGFCGWRQEK